MQLRFVGRMFFFRNGKIQSHSIKHKVRDEYVRVSRKAIFSNPSIFFIFYNYI